MRTRGVTWIVVGAFVALAVAGPALAQVVGRPVRGEFEDTYMVNGRIVDAGGWPVNQAELEVTVTGLKGLTIEPLKIGTNCNGDFQAFFPLGALDGKRARVAVTLLAPPEPPSGYRTVSSAQDLDVVFRRNDFVLALPFDWNSQCQDARGTWIGRVTAWGRAINGTGEREVDGGFLYATAHVGAAAGLEARFNGTAFRAPGDIFTDERGDFKYSWTFEEDVKSATIITAVKGFIVETEYDAKAHIAFIKINTGIVPDLKTPAAPVLFVLVALALAVVMTRGRRA